jgi:hypothetical protein
MSGRIKSEDCILSQTDNTSAAGWLRKSNFADEDDECIQLVTARKLSSLVIASQSCLYSQWFSGESNTISDSLSRDFHANETHLQNLLCANFPSQVPFGLNLHPLPNEIISWATSLLESRPQKEPWLKEQVRSSFARGSAFNPTSSPLVSSIIPTSRASTGDNVIKSYAHLDNISEKVDLVANLPSFSNLSQSVPGYRSTNPGEKPQVAITGSVLRQFYKLAVSSFDKALCQLFIGVFFFAMRSCEYVKVQGPRKTKLLTVKNNRFYVGNRLINHSDPYLSSAECVSITFELQKRDTRNDVITQHRSGDNILCPVRTWAAIIKRLASYPGASPTDTVNLFRFPDGKKHMFSGYF